MSRPDTSGNRAGSPIRIVFVSPDMMPGGGAEQQIYQLMLRLDPERYSLGLVTLTVPGELSEMAAARGVDTHHLAARGRFPLRAFLRLVRILRKPRADIVLMHGFAATVLGRLAALVAGVPVRIVAEHSTGWVEEPSAFNRAVDRRLIGSTTVFIAVADAQRHFLETERGLPRERTVLIYNGIELMGPRMGDRDEARSTLGIASEAFVVGIVATMRPEKDHANFLRAARMLLDRVPGARFVIVGDGECRPQVEALIDELGLRDAVILTGARADVEKLLPAFDVFTLSSSTIETFPMAGLEAMSCGVPVVATDLGGLREMVSEGVEGSLVPARDPGALAGAWAALAADPGKRAAMGAAARRRVEAEFTADTMAERYRELFERLVAEARLSRSGAPARS